MSSKLCIFDRAVFASLLQPLCNSGMDFKAYFTCINMKLVEQRNEISGEKELKFEISKNDDFEFLYAETLNNEKYQTLARDHDLIVDFDTFPKIFIKSLLSESAVQGDAHGNQENYQSPSTPTEITVKLDSEKRFCMLEVFSKTPVSKGRIFSIKLSAVRGDQLITHLLKILSDNQVRKSTLETTTKELEALKCTHSEAVKSHEKMEILDQKIKELAEKNKDLENELELVKEERENIRVLAEDRDEEIEELNAVNQKKELEIEEAKEELEIVGKMLKEEQLKSDEQLKTIECVRKEIRRLHSDKDSLLKKLKAVNQLLESKDERNCERSIDVRKLKELEADLQQKDLLVISLTEAQSVSKKDLDNERQKLAELQEIHQVLKRENDFLKKKLNFRGSEIPSAPLPSSGPRVPPKSAYRSVLPHVSPTFAANSSLQNTNGNHLYQQHLITPLEVQTINK